MYLHTVKSFLSAIKISKAFLILICPNDIIMIDINRIIYDFCKLIIDYPVYAILIAADMLIVFYVQGSIVVS